MRQWLVLLDILKENSLLLGKSLKGSKLKIRMLKHVSEAITLGLYTHTPQGFKLETSISASSVQAGVSIINAKKLK